jgi:hypothetical protein
VSLTLFAANLLESATTVTVTSSATNKPITRVYDRDRALRWEGGSAAQMDIDVDLGAATAVSALGLLAHNVTGASGVTLYGDSSSPATTLRATSVPDGDDVLVTFGSQTLRYWRIRMPTMASAATLGELLLGVPRTITQNPTLPSGRPHAVGNVRRDLSPGGYSWSVRRGEPRATLPLTWRGMSEADLATLDAAYDECREGSKKLLVQLPAGTLYWCDWIAYEAPIPLGGALYDVSVTFEQAL